MLVRVSVERVTLDTSTNRFVIVLKEENRNRWLPIVVGNAEAQAIALQLEKIEPPRPLTHDLIRNLLEAMDVKIERIVVNDLRDNTFFALLGLRLHDEFRNIDARPSDAIALALRAGAPIFVDANVMVLASISDTDYEDREPTLDKEIGSIGSPADALEQLSIDLRKAITEERYEEAAKLRDEIARLKDEMRHNV